MKILILGCGSATPYEGRHQTSVLLEYQQTYFLFDCGEGIQMQLLRYKIKFSNIDHIFITHLHGDHYLGLIGLLSSLHSWGRKKDLHLYGPAGLREILTLQFKYQQTSLQYKIILREILATEPQRIIDHALYEVCTQPLQHRIPCTGFLFMEKPKPHGIIKEKLPKNISLAHIHLLKQGKDVFDDVGNIRYKAAEYTHKPAQPKKFAYITDTLFDQSIVPRIENFDCLFHEATFLSELEQRARDTFHSTAKQAAQIAHDASVKKLIIGHFSARYKTLQRFEAEAREIFKETYLAEEGTWFEF